MTDPFTDYMDDLTRMDDVGDVPLTDMMEDHIFNSYMDGSAGESDVIDQLGEFDLYKAVNILMIYGVKGIKTTQTIQKKITSLYIQCNQFSNWNLDEPEEREQELQRELRNISDSSNVLFLLDIIRLRILYYNHETELKSKRYALIMLNPSTNEGALFGDAVMEGIETFLEK